MNFFTPEIEKTVTQPHFFAIVAVAVHFQRKRFGGPENFAGRDPQLYVAGRQIGVFSVAGPLLDFSGDADHRFQTQRFELRKYVRFNIDHALGQPVMIAEVDKQQIAVIALPVNPPGQAGLCPGVPGAKFSAGMGAVSMHVRTFVRILNV